MKLKRVALVATLLILAVVGWEGWRYWRTDWIPAGYVGVIYDAGSGLQKQVIPPRAVFIGWRQRLYTYPTQLQAAIYTQDPNEGEMKTADGILITTSDNANTIFDVVVIYRVKPDDVITVFNKFGPIPIEEIQTTYIRRAVKEAINAIGTRYDVFALMGDQRQTISELTAEELRKQLGPKGITVESVMLGGCFPASDIQNKINARVNSYTELEISRLKSQIAETERKTALVQAQADSQAQQMSAAQTQQRSLDMLRLQASEAAIAKWNGQLPIVESKPGQTIVLGRDALPQQGGRE